MSINRISLDQEDFILVSIASGDGWQAIDDTSVVWLTEQGCDSVTDEGQKIRRLDGCDFVAEVSIKELIKSHNELVEIKAKAEGYQTKVEGVAEILVRDGVITEDQSVLQVRETIFDYYPEEEDITFRDDVEAAAWVILDSQKDEE